MPPNSRKPNYTDKMNQSTEGLRIGPLKIVSILSGPILIFISHKRWPQWETIVVLSACALHQWPIELKKADFIHPYT